MTSISMNCRPALRLLLVGASSLALSVPALANDVIFSTSATQVEAGVRTVQLSGVTQIKLASGGILSVAGDAQYMINEDGSIDLFKGSITVSGAARSAVEVRMPGGIAGRIFGSSSSSSFSVAEDGEVSGHTLTGVVRVSRDGRNRRPYREGQMWSAKGGENPKRTFANSAVEQPSDEPGVALGPDAALAPNKVVAIGGDAGPVGAALNGIPVTLGDGLAAAGASSDIIAAGRRVEAAAANPTLDRFPSGDLALLVAAAADLESAYGGVPFNAAQADIIRTYLGFLASGASGADFLTAYSNFTLGYLELIRSGGVPSGFDSGIAGASDIDAYLAFIGRTGAISTLGSQDRALADAYLAFLASGQNRDLFASSFTDLTAAYFAFLRGGGVPTEFTGASQEALSQSIAFLQQSGLLVQLSASDQALVTAFLNNGGINFASQFQTALADYFAFLQSGQTPSDYTVLDQATLRSFLETLADTGLLTTALGDSASFYADYLAFLRAGGDVDAFAGLPANVFAGYRADLDAYFAFLEAGGIPSSYTPLSQAVIEEYIAALQEAGATQAFLGDLAPFYEAYFAFLSDGGNPDNFAQLPVPPDFPAFAAALNAYASFLSANGLPSDFTEQDLTDLQAFFTAVEQSGQVDDLLGDNAQLLSAYFDFLESGGGVDAFAALPIYLDYVAELNAYFEFLAAGNLPSEYTVLDAATIELYLAALANLQGGLAAVGNLNSFFANYFDFLLAGNDPDLFGDLPGQGGQPGGNEPIRAALDGINGWQFGSDALRVAATDAQVDENGRITSMTVFNPNGVTTDYSGRDDDLREFGRIGNDVAWTRYFVGSANRQINVSEHLLVGTPATNIPTSGTVQYSLVGGTAPTNRNDEPGTQATFTGELGLSFGSSVRVGLNFDILTRTEGYRVSTAGGAIDPTNGGLGLNGNGRFENSFLGITPLTGTSCTGFCQAQVFGGVFGDGATSAGFTYNVFDRTANNSLQGVAIFAAQGTPIPGLGNAAGDAGSGAPSGAINATRSDVFSTVFYDGADVARGLGTATITGGRLAGFTTGAGDVVPVDASVVEGGANDDVAWGRWTDGRINVTRFLSFNGVNNASVHTVSGNSPTDLPTGGVVQYALIGSTSPTDNQGSAPGTITGNMAVSFDGPRHIGLELSMSVGGKTWSTATTGGIADPTQSEITFRFPQNPFELAAPNVTSSANACVTSCTVNLSGRLFGVGGQSASAALLVNDLSNGVNTLAQGIAIFGAQGSTGQTSRQGLAGAPADFGSAASFDWSRWSAPASAASDTLASIDLSTPAATRISGHPSRNVQPSARTEAIGQAQQMMGGAVTWGDALIR